MQASARENRVDHVMFSLALACTRYQVRGLVDAPGAGAGHLGARELVHATLRPHPQGRRPWPRCQRVDRGWSASPWKRTPTTSGHERRPSHRWPAVDTSARTGQWAGRSEGGAGACRSAGVHDTPPTGRWRLAGGRVQPRGRRRMSTSIRTRGMSSIRAARGSSQRVGWADELWVGAVAAGATV